MRFDEIPAKRVNIMPRQHEILIGSLLADASCILQKGKTRTTAIIRWGHCPSQYAYAEWFLRELDLLSEGHKCYDKKGNVFYYTVSSPDFVKYRTLFYPRDKFCRKVVRKELISQLTPLSLAVWFMDDGHYEYQSRCANISVASRSNASRRNLLCFFKCLNLFPKIQGKNKRFQFNRRETDKLLELIKPFIPPCMNYKLGHLIPENQQHLEKERDKKCEYLRRYMKIIREKDREKYNKGRYEWYHKNIVKARARARELYALKKQQS